MLQKNGYRNQGAEHDKLQKIHAVQSLRVHPQRKRRAEARDMPDAEHKRRGKRLATRSGKKPSSSCIRHSSGTYGYEAPDEEKNFNTLIEMINAMEVREDDEDFENQVDIIFRRAEREEPEPFRGATVCQIPDGCRQDRQVDFGELRRTACGVRYCRNCGKLRLMTNFTLIRWEISGLHSSSSCPTRMPVSIF